MSIDTSPGTLLHYLQAAGTGSLDSMHEVISPKGIFEHIINVLTFGGITRGNQALYHLILTRMEDAFTRETPAHRDDIIRLEEIHGCKVSFDLTDEESKTVSVVVENGAYTGIYKINAQTFSDVRRTLTLRHKLSIPQDPEILTKEGKLNLRGVNLLGDEIAGEDLSNADLTHANLFRANVSSSNLTGADLSFATLIKADFSGAELTGAKLACANLMNANFSNADLINADLSNADMYGATLSDTDLTRADLSCANLTQADLRTADLSNANMTCTNLSHAQLAADTLYWVKGYPGANLHGVVSDPPMR